MPLGKAAAAVSKPQPHAGRGATAIPLHQTHTGAALNVAKRKQDAAEGDEYFGAGAAAVV